jgi:hypothetical protein
MYSAAPELTLTDAKTMPVTSRPVPRLGSGA